MNTSSLFQIIKFIEEQLSIDHSPLEFRDKNVSKRYLKLIKSHLSNYFDNNLQTYLNSDINKKLSVYKNVKYSFDIEPYLMKITGPFIRKSVTLLRLSAHNLYVETGRYSKVKREDRICQLCESNEIEDEVHFLIDCDFYNNIRQKYVNNILQNYCNNRGKLDQLIYLLTSSHDETIEQVGNYVYGAFQKRNQFLYNKTR